MARNRNKSSSQVPALEWAFGFVGFALVAATIVFLAYEALTGGNAPPDIAVRADRIVAQDQGYLVEISATNRGDRTAAAVQVQAELKNGAETVESSEVQFQYLPARSERKGGVYFTHDPRRLKLVIRARGYERP
jgi:uncharacterized protein (TIGR02588 family)